MNFKCFACHNSFAIATELCYHLKIYHVGITRFQCCFCDRVHHHFKSFKRHLMSHVPTMDSYSESNIITPTSHDDQNNDISDLNVNYTNMTKLFIKYCAKSELTRKIAIGVFNDIAGVAKNVIKDECETIENLEIKRVVQNIFKNVFCDIPKSDYFIFKKIKDLNCDINFKKVIIHTRNEESIGPSNNISIKKYEFASKIISTQDLFYKLFNNTPYLLKIIDYINQINLKDNSFIYNFMQSPLFKNMSANITTPDSLCLPLLIYYDDFEVNNPLGSHATAKKLGGIYMKIGCLPPYMQSKLSSTFLLMLFYTEDKKEFGNNRLFQPLVSELNKLSTIGIDINIGKYKKVYLLASLILGDNLGVNSILGFTESFNSKYPCRFCTISKENMRKNWQITANISKNINFNNYEEACSNQFLDTCIKENSVFNNLSFFHVTANFSVDIMHDILEGVCQYDLLVILESFINKRKLISIQDLNYRINTFNYGYGNISKPPLFNTDFIKYKKIKVSASEMSTLINILGLIIGDKVTDNSEEWQLYIVLRKIIDIANCNSFHTDLSILMKNYVEEHNKLYLDVSNSTLKPKHHFLHHYGEIMKQVGSLKAISSIRFESFHQPQKKTAYNTKCKINLIETICKKNQIQMANSLLNFEEIFNKKITYKTKQYIEKNLLLKYKFNCIRTPVVLSYLKIDSIVIKPGCVIITPANKFALVEQIIMYNEEIYFCLNELNEITFCFHYYAFLVEKSCKYYTINYKEINVEKNCYIIEINGTTFINYNYIDKEMFN